jgi:hypothetical protein
MDKDTRTINNWRVQVLRIYSEIENFPESEQKTKLSTMVFELRQDILSAMWEGKDVVYIKTN